MVSIMLCTMLPQSYGYVWNVTYSVIRSCTYIRNTLEINVKRKYFWLVAMAYTIDSLYMMI
jgi:hypothetical protein